ncbi:MAG: hypothetical protein PHI64_22990 [Zoogloea sp.]|uniref:hypothetical protein n=1 Tax=Zoogloea sp. TaxID=49181 RepID=UPI0026084B72|nr:hypothetical protein [Zoogloea sp.]MDD2991808.1 hypothetical protein [Zoogloea sp.]
MTSIITGLISNDSNNLTEIKNAYEKLAEVPAVWIDVDADIKRPVMQRKGFDRAQWFDDVLPRCLQALQVRPGDLDVFVTVENAAESARVLALGGVVARVGGDGGRGADGALDLRGMAPKAAARELARALG